MVRERDNLTACWRRLRRRIHQPVPGVQAGANEGQHHGNDRPHHTPPAPRGETARRPAGRRFPAGVIAREVLLVLVATFRGRVTGILLLLFSSSFISSSSRRWFLPRTTGVVVFLLVLSSIDAACACGCRRRRRQPRHRDEQDAALLEPGADGAGIAAVGDVEVLAEAPPAVAVGAERALAADPEPPEVVDLHPELLLLEPWVELQLVANNTERDIICV
jgi:hypothetical protein